MPGQTFDNKPTDTQLLEGIAHGDEDCLAALYDRYHRLTFSLALRVVNDRGRAEDVVQDAFLSVWRKAAMYADGRGSVKTWLTSIVRNRAIDVIRARRESDGDDEAVLLGLRDSSPSVIEQVTASLDRDTVRAAITVLPVEQRKAIAMAYFEGRSHSEIAGMTGLPLGTVKSRIRLGMHRLRDELVGIGFDMSTSIRDEIPAQVSAARPPDRALPLSNVVTRTEDVLRVIRRAPACGSSAPVMTLLNESTLPPQHPYKSPHCSTTTLPLVTGPMK